MRPISSCITTSLLCVLGSLWLGQGVAGAASIALLPLQDRTGEREAISVVHRELTTQLLSLGSIVDSQRVRQALRQLRVRRAEAASPEILSRLGETVGADWLVSVTIHEASTDNVPRLTLSARGYHQQTGELFWAGFQSGSGLDPRTVLGLKEIRDLRLLAAWVVERLLDDLENSSSAGGPGAAPRHDQPASLGKVAIVPMGGQTPTRGTANAETVTEAVRAIAYRHGVQVVSPNKVSATLRLQPALEWGGVPVPLRQDLNRLTGADTILTGAVEAFDIDNSPDGPRPRIALSLRLVDARTGQVLWADGVEKDVADHPGFFGTRRIYSLGALTERLVETLTRRLLHDGKVIPGNKG